VKRYLDQSPKDLAAKELSQIEGKRGGRVFTNDQIVGVDNSCYDGLG